MASVLEDNVVSDTFSLRLNLNVLASTCIKRKKPWRKLALVGEVCSLLSYVQNSTLVCVRSVCSKADFLLGIYGLL